MTTPEITYEWECCCYSDIRYQVSKGVGQLNKEIKPLLTEHDIKKPGTAESPFPVPSIYAKSRSECARHDACYRPSDRCKRGRLHRGRRQTATRSICPLPRGTSCRRDRQSRCVVRTAFPLAVSSSWSLAAERVDLSGSWYSSG